MRHSRTLLLLAASAAAMTALSSSPAAGVAPPSSGHPGRVLVSGLRGGLGSTVGPDRALYVVEGIAGRITRVDPRTGHTSTFASGLPKRVNPIPLLGGPTDIAFVGHTAYVLVTMVGPDLGGSHVDGIYRIDGPRRSTVVADIGAWSIAHPPKPAFFVVTGVQYAMQPYRGAFLVTDGHHNRVLRVTLDGTISQRIAFGDVVPLGLDVRRGTVFLSQAGPVPHLPRDGKILTFRPGSHKATEVASGGRLLVDVQFGADGSLYALSQGHFTPGHDEGTPADPGTGALLRVNLGNGTMTPIAKGLDRPTSLEIIGTAAYVVTLSGNVLKINVARHTPRS